MADQAVVDCSWPKIVLGLILTGDVVSNLEFGEKGMLGGLWQETLELEIQADWGANFYQGKVPLPGDLPSGPGDGVEENSVEV